MKPTLNSFRLSALLVFLFYFTQLEAQLKIPVTYGDGLSLMAEDSSFLVNMGFRFQTLYAGALKDDSWNDQMLIRRSRLKFDGFVFNKNIEFKLELGLSNRDIGGGQTPQNGPTPNIIFDAVIKWTITPDLALWFGQTKLPGNRERIISSQKMQFVDRSLLNARFNLDRDIGIQLHHTQNFGNAVLRKIVSVSMGEGRNNIIGNFSGYDYTARIEYLPFGLFAGNGEYFGSDLKREPKPKLAIAVSADYNDNAVRSRGQLGNYVTDASGSFLPQDMTTLFVDAMFKCRGFSAMSEFASKLIDSRSTGFVTGTGFVAQAGYLLKSNWEFAGRFATVSPDHSISVLTGESHYTVGVSKYISGHDLKVQSDVTHIEKTGSASALQFRVQVELAF